MKALKTILAAGIVIVSQMLMSCFPDHSHKDLRIRTFLWETVRYRAEYSHHGLLNKLKAADRSINFYYDEDQKLYKAEIIFQGSSSPESVFEYIQGPKGITRVTWSRGGHVWLVTEFTYAGDGTITQIINAYGGSVEARDILTPVHFGNNVQRIFYAPQGHVIEMRTESFDNHVSPFHMLAESVNNPAFFPLGYYVVSQIGDYNIPYINWLSENNPRDLYLVYKDKIGGEDVYRYPLSYVYQHNLVTKMTWGTLYDSPGTRIFEFEYGFY